MDDTADTDILDVLKSQHNEAKSGWSAIVDAQPSERSASFEKLSGVPVACFTE